MCVCYFLLNAQTVTSYLVGLLPNIGMNDIPSPAMNYTILSPGKQLWLNVFYNLSSWSTDVGNLIKLTFCEALCVCTGILGTSQL